MRNGFLIAALTVAVYAIGTTGTTAYGFGLDPESNIDGFNPGADTHELNEARRQNLISRQLDLNNTLLWLNGRAGIWGSEPAVRQPIGHESIQVSPNKWIYRPIYAEDAQPQPSSQPEKLPTPTAQPEKLPTPQPQVQPQAAPKTPQAPGPVDAKPGDRMPAPKKPIPRGPRVF